MPGEGEDGGDLLAWCVVANVAAETAHGEGGQEIHKGLKHFAPGAKVWVLPPQWGDGGENLFVVGRHRGRGPGRLARMVVGRHHLADFRVRGVYSPAVHRELTRPWKHWGDHPLRLWESREQAERAVQWWNTEHAARSGVTRPLRRGDLIAAVAVCADIQPWPPLPYAVGRIACDLFGDPPDLPAAMGSLLRDHREAEAVGLLLGALRAIIDELGSPQPDTDYRSHRRWPEASTAASAAHGLLTQLPNSSTEEPTVSRAT